jgi:ribonuclease P protein component
LTASFIVFTLWSDKAPLRLGITVSKRVGGAVVRNRVKRLVREAFRHTKERFSQSQGQGLQLVIVAKADAARLDYPRAYAELLEICRRCSPRT